MTLLKKHRNYARCTNERQKFWEFTLFKFGDKFGTILEYKGMVYKKRIIYF